MNKRSDKDVAEFQAPGDFSLTAGPINFVFDLANKRKVV
jgi:hypothetical protein